jgi:hypothetical protein
VVEEVDEIDEVNEAALTEQFNELTSPASHFLRSQFSSGIRFNELKSIAKIAIMLTNVEPPTRAMKRHFPQMIQWFHNNWDRLAPIMPCIQLRDEHYFPIDGNRELVEQHLIGMLIE